MPNESGDLKLLANFPKLIDLVSADKNYRPANVALKLTTLEPQPPRDLQPVRTIFSTGSNYLVRFSISRDSRAPHRSSK